MSRHSSRGPNFSSYKPQDPAIGLQVILWVFAGFFILCLIGSIGHAQERTPTPPIINEIKAPVTHPVPIQVEQPQRAKPADGPMCLPPFEEEPEPATLLGVLLEQPANEAESLEVTKQMHGCWRGETKAADPFLVLALYRYEETLGVPRNARGVLGAIWCSESAFRTRSSRIDGPVRGDYLNGYAGAWGSLQLHAWAEKGDKCGLTPDGRDDLFASASCWWSRVLVRVESPFVVALHCRNPWPLAEALVANQGTYAKDGCKARSEHYRELERWRSRK